MRVLIAGAGRAGLSVAASLRTSGHDVVIVERDPVAAARAFEDYGLVSLTGDAADAALLRDAELHRFDVVVAMLRRDADNLAVASLARAAGVPKILVRMRDPEYRPVYEAVGIKRILSEVDVLVGALVTAIEHEAIRHAMVLGGGGSVAFELTVPEKGTVVGKTIGEIATSAGFPSSCVVAGMVDASGEFQAPRGGSLVSAKMTLLIVARRAELGQVVAFFMLSSDA